MERRICALGPVPVYRQGQAITDWTYAKGRDLLFYLLCHPPRIKEQVGLVFWPDAAPVAGDGADAGYHPPGRDIQLY